MDGQKKKESKEKMLSSESVEVILSPVPSRDEDTGEGGKRDDV